MFVFKVGRTSNQIDSRSRVGLFPSHTTSTLMIEEEDNEDNEGGECKMQEEVAEIISGVPNLDRIGGIIVDCLPNMNDEQVKSLAPALFLQLRTNLGRDMPIFILEGHTYANAWILPIVKQDQDAKRASQYNAFLTYRTKYKDTNIHYVKGDGKLAKLGDIRTSDATSGIGVHPTNVPHLYIGKFVADEIRGQHHDYYDT